MDYVIEQRLANIERMARHQKEAAQQILRDIEGIYGYCAGVETVMNDFPYYSEYSPALQPQQLNYDNEFENIQITETENGLLKFTEKEISKMPKKTKKIFRTQGNAVHYRKRTDGRYNCSYEIRYAKKPYNKHPISVSATTLKELKARFIEKLNNCIPQSDDTIMIPTNFDEFAMYWFENFHKRKVAEPTYKKNLDTYKRDIQKHFIGYKLSGITPVKIQNFLDGYSDKARTAETLHSILNQVFISAVKHGILRLNPLDICIYKKHQRQHGNAISKENEKRLLSAFADTEFLIDFAVALYTGLRPNEYPTAKIENGFIVARNSKRKGGKEETKKIPITPMLRSYISKVSNLQMHRPALIAKKLKSVLPEHTLYDTRTTFQTRCTECGINDTAIGLFMGNSIGNALKEAYTDISDEWLIKEGEKLKY